MGMPIHAPTSNEAASGSTGARVLSTYSERILPDREVWIAGGRIAAVKPAGSHKGDAKRYDAGGGILAPGLVDPHIHIESSMVTACAYAEAALLNGGGGGGGKMHRICAAKPCIERCTDSKMHRRPV